MRNSLFLKVYLTLLASLVVVALASAAFVRLSHDEEDRGWGARRNAFIAAMLPADAPPEETRMVLARLGEAFDADVTVFAADGTPIAQAGEPVPFVAPDERGDYRRGEHRRQMAVRLADGRVVVARFEGNPFGPPRASPLAWLALVAGVTGVVAWPVVRHLTRRLERLRQGVERWGEGDLALRVPAEGRDEVAAVARSFNRAAGRIEGLIAAHRSLLANASHELRSPLARLRMAIDLYEEDASQARRDEIVRNLAELDELVEEILLASRLDHVRELGETEPLDLLALAAEEAALHGMTVAGQTVRIEGDRRLLARLVRNLILNAERHGAPPIEIEVAKMGDIARLSVRDHGPGVAEAERSRVFEAFYRPSGRSESAGGWGLGLALVRQIAERHGGSVSCETAPGKGARFVVDLPAVS